MGPTPIPWDSNLWSNAATYPIKAPPLCQAGLRPEPDDSPDFVPSPSVAAPSESGDSPSVAPDSEKLGRKLEFDSQADSTIASQSPGQLSPAFKPAEASSSTPPAAASSTPPLAAASSAAAHGKANAGQGRPAVKAAAGAEAQAEMRRSERLRRRHKVAEAEELLKQRIEAEGETITSPYAAKQAKAIANQLFATAGGAANAQKVVAKFALLPEVRALDAIDEHDPLRDRCFDNFIRFLNQRLSASGTRHAEDQNVLDALLTAHVDGDMIQDRLINAVANMFGARWHAIKRAVLTRLKTDDEMREGGTDGVWTRRPRDIRGDKYELMGFYLFMHDETFFKFSSRHQVPVRRARLAPPRTPHQPLGPH